MLKKLARWVLRKDYQLFRDQLDGMASEVETYMAKVEYLEGVLDTYNESFTLGLGVEKSADLAFTKQETDWMKAQVELGTLPMILDKLLFHIITGFARSKKPATEYDAQRLQNIRAAYYFLMEECIKASGKKVTVDPLTTEVKVQEPK